MKGLQSKNFASLSVRKWGTEFSKIFNMYFRVEVADEGEYICIAKNPAGVIEESARLEVYEQPQFLVKPVEVTVERGGTATFHCKVKGHPTPALFWLREGQQVFSVDFFRWLLF